MTVLQSMKRRQRFVESYETVNYNLSNVQIDNDAGPEPIDVFHSDEDDDGEAVKKEKEPSTSSEASAQAASEFRSRLTSDSSKKTRCESNLQKLIKLGIIKVEPASDRPPKPKVCCAIVRHTIAYDSL